MAKAILNCSPYSGYENRLPHEYHFRQRHRGDINMCYQDDVIFYELGHRGGRQGYVATAKLWRLQASEKMGHYFAILTDYRPFERLVPFVDPDGLYYEREAISPTGRFRAQASVRFPNEETFDRILVAGGLLPMAERGLPA
jgi:hypothetical protein